ncbi:MAG: M23 family metallopeptidase [Deltaproteobacteria bacterium]|nr:M23 family metallopeptidase [Deltaproteobacteria bacterium]
MKEKITIFWLTVRGTGPKRISISPVLLIAFCMFFLTCIATSGFVFYSFQTVNSEKGFSKTLKNTISQQNMEIKTLNEQIQSFADKINVIKTRLAKINEFEDDIRIITNIKKKNKKESFVGMGGSMQSDAELDQFLKHSDTSLLREMHEQLNQINSISLTHHNDFEQLLKILEEKKSFLASIPTIAPVKGRVTSQFGYRTSPFTGKKEFHYGYDISAPIGTKIVAPADGVVSFAGRKGSFGNTVMIDHGYGIITQYGHTSKALKKVGAKIKRGEAIAEVGNTGRSTGPHVHYEVILNGIKVNPKKYILD